MRSVETSCRLAALTFLGLALIAQWGCAGAGGSGAPAPWISPYNPTVAASSVTQLEAGYLGVESVDWSVREGAAGGSLAPFTSDNRFFATYTAPSTPGTFHVDVTFHHTGGGTSSFSSPVTVQ